MRAEGAPSASCQHLGGKVQGVSFWAVWALSQMPRLPATWKPLRERMPGVPSLTPDAQTWALEPEDHPSSPASPVMPTLPQLQQPLDASFAINASSVAWV